MSERAAAGAGEGTLAQGLNLSATTLIFHSLKRGNEPIDIAEFRNVVGRAGRAYVDVEGLVLMPRCSMMC